MNHCNNCNANKVFLKKENKKCRFWTIDGACLSGRNSKGKWVISKLW